MPAIEVDLVADPSASPLSGIGRYRAALLQHLQADSRVDPRPTSQVSLPLTRLSPFFRHIPIGTRERRPGSVVHFLEDLGCSQMLWRPVRPAVATSHDLGMLTWPPEAAMHRLPDRTIWRLSYRALRRMDAVMADSEFARRTLIERLGMPEERVFTVRLGLDHDRFRQVPDARARLATRVAGAGEPSTRLLLYVGTEIPRKNLATILQALKLLPRSFRLLKVGGPGYERSRADTLAEIDRLGIADRVEFFDEVSDEELPLFYSAADVYVSSSLLEGFGYPVLEAMACATPVVCSDVASLPEITGGAAILLPPHDAPGFASAIAALADNGTRRREMATAGIARASEFTWARTIEGVVSVYERAVSMYRAPRA